MIFAYFTLMMVGHFIADSVLQPGWLSQRKYDRDPSVAARALLVHGAVHALPVAMVTGRPELAVAEMLIHPLIDLGKRRGWYGIYTDQILHTICKVAWVVLAFPWWLTSRLEH